MERRSRYRRQLAMVTLIVLGLFRSTQSEYYRHVPADTRYYIATCDRDWCGEKWRSDRILYYNYSVSYTTEEQNITVSEVTRNCFNSTGATVHSNQCELTTTNSTGRTGQVHNVTVKHVTRSHDRTITLPESLSLGIIKSDNIGTFGNLSHEMYPANRDKIWQIKIPHRCRMIIYFQEFDLEPSIGCTKDYFTIQTSKSQANVRKYCNSLYELEFRYRRRVQLWFHSDDTVTKRGIYAALCPSNWPPLNEDEELPCTCNTSRRSRRRAPSDVRRGGRHRQAHKARKQEDKEIGTWLADMMQNGRPAVDRYLRDYDDIRQRDLAENYLKAMGTITLHNS